MDFPDAYIFHIKETDNFNDMEYAFLHEFFHCIQNEEGFPHVVCNNPESDKIAAILSSVVLDLNVINRLELHNYFENPLILDNMYHKLYVLFSAISNNNLFEIESTFNSIYYACQLTYLEFMYPDKEKLSLLINKVKSKSTLIYNLYVKVFNIIYKHNYNNKKGVYKIFKTLIKELCISENVSIS